MRFHCPRVVKKGKTVHVKNWVSQTGPINTFFFFVAISAINSLIITRYILLNKNKSNSINVYLFLQHDLLTLPSYEDADNKE